MEQSKSVFVFVFVVGFFLGFATAFKVGPIATPKLIDCLFKYHQYPTDRENIRLCAKHESGPIDELMELIK